MKNEKEIRPLPEDKPESPGPQNAVQRFYERFRGVPLKYIDTFIAVCVGALILLLVWGTLKGRGVI